MVVYGVLRNSLNSELTAMQSQRESRHQPLHTAIAEVGEDNFMFANRLPGNRRNGLPGRPAKARGQALSLGSSF